MKLCKNRTICCILLSSKFTHSPRLRIDCIHCYIYARGGVVCMQVVFYFLNIRNLFSRWSIEQLMTFQAVCLDLMRNFTVILQYSIQSRQ